MRGLLPLGYGHQLAAVGTVWRGGPRGVFFGVLLFTAALAAFEHLLVGPASGPVLALLSIVAVWHVVENEVALGRRRLERAGLRLPPFSRGPRAHVRPLLWTLALLTLALWLPRLAPTGLRWGLPGRWVIWTVEELIALVLLHHVVSFLILAFALGRGARVLATHSLPLAAALVTLWGWPGLFGVLASPSVYLLCSAAHAVQSVRARGWASE